MKKRIFIISLCLVIAFSLGTLVLAEKSQNEPIQTATEYSQFNTGEECEEYPTPRHFREMEERELFLGENGVFQRLMRQRFGK